MFERLKHAMKALTSDQEVFGSMVRQFDGMGTNGSQRAEFNQAAGVAQGAMGWAFVAGNHVAKACASAPLRLYIRNGGSREKLYRTGSVRKSTRDYLTGHASVAPSVSTMSKIAELGDDFQEVTEPHPVLTTLRAGNDIANGYDMTISKWLYQQFAGNAYWAPIIDPTLGIPTSYWLLPPQWTQIIPRQG